MKRNTSRAHGLRQLDRIVDLITAEPMSAEQLADAMQCTKGNIVIYLRRLKAATPPRVHVYDHAPPVDHGGRPRPIYAAGDHPDEVFEAKRKPPLQYDRVARSNALILAALADTPMTAQALAELVNRSKSRTLRLLRTLREADPKQVYIAAWSESQSQGDIAPLYKAGNRPCKPKPKQSRAARYKKELANKEQHALNLAKRRARRRATSAATRSKSKPTTWLSALGA